MKNLITLTSLVLLLCGSAQGQTFNSGSTGADGAFIARCFPAPPCTIEVPLREPPNHIFNFTTVTIDAGATVKFTPNKANTPVFILAQGDAAQGTGVIINGQIDMRGEVRERGIIAAKGGPGGFSGGMADLPGSPTNIGGAGNGPGGGGGGTGTAAPRPGAFESAYGTPELQPLIGGSGGGGGAIGEIFSGSNGTGGGGALLIASSGVIDMGSLGPRTGINASGGRLFRSLEGSGGAIRLVATVLRGNSELAALGGRIRLEAAQANQYTGITSQATFNPPGQPLIVFPPITPTLRILSIGGVPLPAQPTAAAHTPDIALPAPSPGQTSIPVTIELEATNVPNNTPFRVFVGPQFGAGDRVIFPRPEEPNESLNFRLSGPVGQPKRATVLVNLPPSGVGIISALIDSVVPEP